MKNSKGSANVTLGLGLLKTYLPYAMALFVAIGCNNPQEKNQTVDPEPVVVPHQPKMDTVAIQHQGENLGNFIYKDSTFQEIQINNEEKQLHNGDIHVITKNGGLYAFLEPGKLGYNLPMIYEIPGQSLKFIDNALVIVGNDGKTNIYEMMRTDIGLINKQGPEVSSFVTIQDNTINTPQDIQSIKGSDMQNKGIVFITPDGKKLFYIDSNKKGLDNLLPVQDVVIEKDYLSLHTTNGKLYYTGSCEGDRNKPSDYTIPYDRIVELKQDKETEYNKKILLIKNDNIMNYDYAQVQTFFTGLKANKLVTKQRPEKKKEDEKKSNSMNDVINNTKNQEDDKMIITNVTNQFRNFKIKYIGIVDQGGEGGYSTTFSQDTKKFYSFYGPDEDGTYVVQETPLGAIENIISEGSLPSTMVMCKALTGQYATQATEVLHYTGADGIYQQTVYTIQGAPGDYIQNGEEVKNVLNENYSHTIQYAAEQGYELVGYLVEQGGKKVALEASTKCPKGTKIYFRYKKKTPEKK